jgi:restriction system protein
MSGSKTIWGIHMEWDDAASQSDSKEIAIGWEVMGDLSKLSASRDTFKAAYAKLFPAERPGAIPVKAGVLYRFSKEMKIGDIVVYPSKHDRMVNIGIIAGDYAFRPEIDKDYPHRRAVHWKVRQPRAQFTQAALYEIGSAITLFQVSNNSDEFLAALDGKAFRAADIDEATAAEIAVQADESVEDFVIKRLKNGISAEQFEQFVAELLRSMDYHVRVSRYAGDGGVDIIAHRDELGFEPPIIKVQCKQMLTTIGGPTVQQLLGAIQPNEHALFVTLGDYSADAVRIERGKSNLRLISGSDLVQMILNNYEKFDPRFKALLPLKRSYVPSGLQTDTSSSAG